MMDNELKIDEDIARGSPGGIIDYPTHESIEEALDRANAPITESGRFLTLVERIAAFGKHQRQLRSALIDLTAIVRGECPSLLSEDSGGFADLSLRIDDIIANTAP